MTGTETKLDWWENVREVQDVDIELGAMCYRWDVLIDGEQLTHVSWDRSDRDEALLGFRKAIAENSVVKSVALPDGALAARYLTKEEGPYAIESRIEQEDNQPEH